MQTKRQAQELVHRFEALIESYVSLVKGSVSQLTRLLNDMLSISVDTLIKFIQEKGTKTT
jgi:hypothetical protein